MPRVFGHTTTNATACPGATLAPLIPAIAAEVQALIDGGGPNRRKLAKQKLLRQLKKCKRAKGSKKQKRCRKRARRQFQRAVSAL